MRPLRLEMEGFTSFRDHTVVDFEDTDLFVLTGPTGAGKSSVIDAMVFALYGSIPRLDDLRAVAPVISRGMLQARVRLDFSVGARRYTAVRVARVTKKGATTPEARLEDDAGNTLAGSAPELSERVKEILGLSFDHFTRSIVLPQGDFADLLHESAGERQKMLQQLLGTELYGRLASRARSRGTEAEVAAQLLESDIAQGVAAGVTAEGLKAARQRVEDLDRLVKRIEEQQPEIERLGENMRLARQITSEVQERLRVLSGVRVPEGVAELAERIAKGRRALHRAKEAHDSSLEERRLIQKGLDRLPREADLRLDLRRYEDLAKARKKEGGAASGLREAQTNLELVQSKAEKAGREVEDAQQARRSMEDEHRAYHLASGLAAGDRCPVCHQDVAEPPVLEAPVEMEEIQEAFERAREHRERADAKLVDARYAVAAQEQGLKNAEEQVRALESELKDADPREDLEAALEQVLAAARLLREADGREKEAGDRLSKAERVVKALEEEEKRAWREYDTQRDRVAEMQPPSDHREKLAEAWDGLAGWAREQERAQRALLEEGKKKGEERESALEEIRESIAGWCSEADVAVADGEEPLTECRVEMARQQEAVKGLARALADLERRRKDLALRRKEGRIASDLARHLGARNFERWLMAKVLEHLCVGSSTELRRLSSDSYSLDLDGSNNFVVVDHRNADERRPVKTLSGGETFLASLSLALALSEHLTDLAVGGAAKLEALFLDEGFGTLDSDTLDVVISAIEELGSRGRMVGVVTHVKELAESIPVRYEVTKEGNRSSIERVEA